MASNVSFDITPQNRFGNVFNSGQSSVIDPPDKGASSTPMKKKNNPFAASAKATG